MFDDNCTHCNDETIECMSFWNDANIVANKLGIAQARDRAFGETLLWRHNGRDSVSNHQPHDCLFNRLIWRRSKKTSKHRVTGLCAGNSPGTGEFPAQLIALYKSALAPLAI